MTETKRPGGTLGRVAVIVPTYDERENLEPIVARVRASVADADILVIDDNSPDGTGEVADKLVAADPHVHVLHRQAKSGLGSAYITGFRWALDRGYGVLVEMDADGSHDPAELPALLAALEHADLVIGSRWVPGGTVLNWPKSREILSRGARTRSSPAATASRLTSSCGPSGRGWPSPRCRSLSPSAPAAPAR